MSLYSRDSADSEMLGFDQSMYSFGRRVRAYSRTSHCPPYLFSFFPFSKVLRIPLLKYPGRFMTSVPSERISRLYPDDPRGGCKGSLIILLPRIMAYGGIWGADKKDAERVAGKPTRPCYLLQRTPSQTPSSIDGADAGEVGQIASHWHRNRQINVSQQPTLKAIRVVRDLIYYNIGSSVYARLAEMASETRSGTDLYLKPRSNDNAPGYYGKARPIINFQPTRPR